MMQETDIFQMIFVPRKNIVSAEVTAGQRLVPMCNY